MTRSTYPFHSHGCNHLWEGEALVNHFEFNHNDDTGDDARDDYENAKDDSVDHDDNGDTITC